MPKIDGVTKATGRGRGEWFALLDEWGARGRPYREIADWLTGEHGLSRWWAQKLIVEYEQGRGIRDPGVRRDGTFEVGASKTVAVPVATLYDAFVDGRRRRRWLDTAGVSLRASAKNRAARFDWSDDTRVNVAFEPKGRSKTAVAVTHQRLRTSKDAEEAKTMWRQRLSELKELLEN